MPLFSLARRRRGQADPGKRRRVRLTRAIGKRAVPQLKPGKARIVVDATRPVLFGYREVSSTRRAATSRCGSRRRASRVALDCTTSSTTAARRSSSTACTPADADSGVRVGDVVYPGFPAAGAGVAGADAVAAGGVLRAALRPGPQHADQRVRARRGRQRSAAPRSTPRLSQAVPQEPHRGRRSFLAARSCRRSSRTRRTARWTTRATCSRRSSRSTATCASRTTPTIAALAAKTAPQMLWKGAVQAADELRGRSRASPISAPTSTRARRVDQQVHLGFDLASTAAAPVAGRQPRRRGARRLPRHLRQLRDRRSRHGPAVALRAPVVDRREGGRDRRAGTDARPQRRDRTGRRRSPALHDAARRPGRDAGRLVERAVDRGPRHAQAARGRPAARRPPTSGRERNSPAPIRN